MQSSSLAALSALALACAAPGSASAALSFIPCSEAAGFSCASLGVPIDRLGGVPGTISLSVERKLAGPAPSSSALVAMAGGPGQPALPFASSFATTMAAGLKTRDLLVFDQRGTGNSDPLSCPAIEGAGTVSPGRRIELCAGQIGPARGGFTTQETVQDIEALRRAGGYEKLFLYGTSYGTKVALEYAERYPEHVEGLLLDSVVPSDGLEPLRIPSLEAVGPVVRELCSQLLCQGITGDPLADLTRLIARLRRHALRGVVYDGLGRRHRTAISEIGLLNVLLAGDVNPALRALQPAAVRSALNGDPDPLLRMEALAAGLVPNVPSGRVPSGGEESDAALFLTTTCEEAPFPWSRSAGARQRLTELSAFVGAQPASDFAPFDGGTAIGASIALECAFWQDASPAPPPAAPLPAVPTLILSGAQDLRTPTSNALKVAGLIPGAELVVVPFTGHSVIGSDLGDCAAKAVAAFFAGAPVQPCTSQADRLPPTRLSPTRLSAVRAPAGLPGLPGRTLAAALSTIQDLSQQVITATLQAQSRLPNGASFGGLRGGYARISSSAVTLRALSFVPGVQLSGAFQISHGQLLTSTIRVSGSSAAAGFVRFGSASTLVTGVLGGRAFALSRTKVRLARAGGGGWPARAPQLTRLGRSAGPRLSARLP